MDLFKLVARLVLDTSGFEQGVNKSRGLFSGLGKTMGAGAVAVGNLVSTGITKAVGAVVQFGKDSLQTGIDFEAAMDRVAAISGTTGTKFDELVEKAMEMGAQTKFSATESAAAFEYMAMAGWDADQMMAGIAGVMDLAAASGENLATVSDIVTDVLTAMGESAGEAGRFADVLAAASSASNTNVAMMGETFKYAAPLAGALGYSIEDLALATGLMANAGIKGSQSGTSLRSILTRLAKPVKQSQQAMDKLGISMTNSDGSMKSLREVMVDLRSSFAGLTETEQASYAAMIGGQEAMSGLLAIVNASEEDFNNLCKSIDESKDAAKSMAEIMMDNVGGSLEELGGAMETLGLTLWDKIKEPLKNAIDFVSGFVSSVTAAFQNGGWEAAAQAATEKLTPVFQTAFAALETAAGNAVNTGANVLAGIYNGLTGDTVNAEAVKQYFSTLWSDVSSYVQTVVTGWGSVLGDIYTALTGDSENGEKIKNTIKGVFEDPMGTMDTLVTKAKTLFTDLFSSLSGDAEAGESIKTQFETIFGGVKAFFDNTATQAGTILSEIAAAVTGDAEGAEALKLAFATVFDDPIATISSIIENGGMMLASIAEALGADSESAETVAALFVEFFTRPLSVLQTMIDKGRAIITEITAAFNSQEKRTALITAVKEAFQATVDYISSLPGQALQWGKDLISQFVEGILSMWESLKAKVKSIADTVKGWFSGLGGGGGKSDGNHAVGLDYVPKDNYVANLHRGEAVLTRSEAEDWRADKNGKGTTIVVNQYINSEAQTAADLMREARWEQERGVLMGYAYV